MSGEEAMDKVGVGFLTPTAFHVLVNIHSNQIKLNEIIAGKWLTTSGQQNHTCRNHSKCGLYVASVASVS